MTVPGQISGLRGMSEDQLLGSVVSAARWQGWRVMHQRPARTLKGWRTLVQGDAGFPDLVLAHRNGRVLFRELKVGRGRLSEPQREWLDVLKMAGADARVWRDSDWPDLIMEELRP